MYPHRARRKVPSCDPSAGFEDPPEEEEDLSSARESTSRRTSPGVNAVVGQTVMPNGAEPEVANVTVL